MDLFKKLDVAYIDQPYNTFVDLKTLAVNCDYFKQYKNQLVVINFSSENHIGFENYVYDQLAKTDVNFLLLTYNHEQHQKYTRMIYFPYWLSDSMETFPVWLSDSSNWQRHSNKITSKTYSLGCLNGNPRPHRIVNFLKLRKKPYWDKTSINFYSEANVGRPDDLKLTADEIIEWNKIKESLPTAGLVNLNLNLPQLVDSYLHLVTETTVSKHSIFITEKTWKTIAVGVPFVMWGNAGTMDLLKQQGVDIYDDIIDHKYYDTEKSARLRLDKLHTVIDDLMAQGIDKIYNQLSYRVVANQTKFFNSKFSQSYLQTLIDTIEQYK